jgi:hypothetical protein
MPSDALLNPSFGCKAEPYTASAVIPSLPSAASARRVDNSIADDREPPGYIQRQPTRSEYADDQ